MFGGSAYAAFPGTAGNATQYQVTIKKVVLCTASDGAGSCSDPHTIGSGDKSFDIASAAAGGQVGSYANLTTLPITTYSYVQVTIDPAIVATGSGSDGGLTCYTSASGGGSVSVASSGSNTAPAQSTTIYVPHFGSYNAGTGATTLSASDFQTSGARGYIDRPSDSEVVITYALTAAYTVVRERRPTITVKFDVSSSLGFLRTGATTCSVFPEPPSVTITVQ
jgi:hypothetical protein